MKVSTRTGVVFSMLSLMGMLAVPALAEEEKNEIPAPAKAILEKATEWELYSINPSRPDLTDPNEEKPENLFHDWEVLGMAKIKTAKTRESLLNDFVKGVEENEGVAALCFNPRHAIRATHEGQTADFVICFECMQVLVYLSNEEKPTGFLITDSPQKNFDATLKEARVPLAPPRVELPVE